MEVNSTVLRIAVLTGLLLIHKTVYCDGSSTSSVSNSTQSPLDGNQNIPSTDLPEHLNNQTGSPQVVFSSGEDGSLNQTNTAENQTNSDIESHASSTETITPPVDSLLILNESTSAGKNGSTSPVPENENGHGNSSQTPQIQPATSGFVNNSQVNVSVSTVPGTNNETNNDANPEVTSPAPDFTSFTPENSSATTGNDLIIPENTENNSVSTEPNAAETTRPALAIADKQFVGTMRFLEVYINNKTISWSDELLNSTSKLTQELTHMTSKLFDSVYDQISSYAGSEIVAFTEGSIILQYQLYFTKELDLIADDLADMIINYLRDTECSNFTQSCNITGVGIIDLNSVNISAKAYCDSPSGNSCDPTSTLCVSHGDGTYGCQCKPGYQSWPDVQLLCKDIDECSNDSTYACDLAISSCVNTPGSYTCECLYGFKAQNNTCIDVCEPNPCKHEGKCTRKLHHYVCECSYSWAGENCEDENTELQRWRTIAIIVAVLTCLISVVLLVACILACLRSRQSPRRAQTAQRLDVRLDEWQYEPHSTGYQMVDAAEDNVSSFTGGNSNPAYKSGEDISA